MAKKDKQQQDDAQPIEPLMVLQQEVPAPPMLEVPRGYVLLTALADDGSDRQGSEFFYPEKSYRKYFGDETKFRVKAKNELTEYNPTQHETLHRTSQQIILRSAGRCSSCGQ